MDVVRRFLLSTVGFNPVSWLRYTARLGASIRAFLPQIPREPGGSPYAVVIAPWVGSGVPLFSLACAVLLAARAHPVTLFIDDIAFGANAFRYNFILACIRRLVGQVRDRLDVRYLSSYRSAEPPSSDTRRTVHRLAYLNAVWAMRGEMIEEGRKSFEDRSERQLLAAFGAINAALEHRRCEMLLVPGGVYGNSGLWFLHAKARGIRVATYDTGGYQTLMLASDGIACQLRDIPKAFRALKDRCTKSEQEAAFVAAAAQAEMARRRSGSDRFVSQIKGAGQGGEEYRNGILIALNSSWDAAALGLQTVFASNMDWIVETVRFLLDNTDVPVIVRQHPAERLEIARTTDDYGGLLRKAFGENPRLHFIAAAEPINSYALLEKVQAVVVYTSTIGIEATANSKPVVTASNSYYSKLGFVWNAADRASYNATLRKAADGELVVSGEMQRDAVICYYLTQCANWVFTSFNPADIREWSDMSFDELQGDINVRSVIQSLEENTPVALLNHRAAYKSAVEAGTTPGERP